MKIDFKTLKPIRGGKIKMEDPPRFPKVIISLENKMKDSYEIELNKMIIDLTKLMVNIVKNKPEKI